MANQIIVNAKAEKSTISRMIYGHFAEHLGRCIYDGFYVGKDSKIPKMCIRDSLYVSLGIREVKPRFRLPPELDFSVNRASGSVWSGHRVKSKRW